VIVATSAGMLRAYGDNDVPPFIPTPAPGRDEVAHTDPHDDSPNPVLDPFEAMGLTEDGIPGTVNGTAPCGIGSGVP